MTPEQIAILRKWIDQGANAPDESIPEDPRRHWAFFRPKRPPLPKVADPAWGSNPIDAFLAAGHDRAKLRPRPPAPKEVLLRRVTLDLTGLPPTHEELHAFLADTSPDAYERVVDRLLASPRYGERWARHWMDVWRYSDWYGRRAVPDVWNSAPQIWRWRDWIVDSLNADKGYDRMVVEMLAGDEVAPEDERAGYATGFLVRNWYALNPNQWMRDQVDHTGKAFLGLTFNCAHCHDHKYDPITQEEYFRFRAFFEPLGLRQDRVEGEPDPGPFQKYDYATLRRVVKIGAVRVLDENPAAPTLMYRMGDERDVMKDRPRVTPGAPAFLGGDRLKIEPVSLPPTAFYPGLRPFVQREAITDCETSVRAAEVALAQARRALATGNGVRAAGGVALTAAPLPLLVAEAALATAKTRLAAVRARIAADNVRYGRSRGDAAASARTAARAERLFALRAAEEERLRAEKARLKAPGAKADAALSAAVKKEEAARKALAAPGATYTPLSPVYPATSTGRRRALAAWIASRDNPLTARVAVNHIWKHYFHRPLVETVFDFGRNGKRPTHPELLDWLSVELMESNWGMKRLHRLIVTSSAYKMRSGTGPEDAVNLAADPDNRLLWHFPSRRLEAEVVRDSILSVAGELDCTMGGYPLDNAADASSRRRSLYFSVYPEDGGHLRILDLFDPPDPCDCYRRSESIVPQQALALTNSRLILDHSRLLARKLPAGAGPRAFVRAAFEQVLARGPTPAELAACEAFLRKQEALFRRTKAGVEPSLRARESLIRVLFNHDDFVTLR